MASYKKLSEAEKAEIIENINFCEVALQDTNLSKKARAQLIDRTMRLYGKVIDPETAYLTKKHIDMTDPYGTGVGKSGCIGRGIFAHNSGEPWVFCQDIPDDIWQYIKLNCPYYDDGDVIPF